MKDILIAAAICWLVAGFAGGAIAYSISTRKQARAFDEWMKQCDEDINNLRMKYGF